MLGSVILGAVLQSAGRRDAVGPKVRQRAGDAIAVTVQGCRLEGGACGVRASHAVVARSAVRLCSVVTPRAQAAATARVALKHGS
jgi:hypothetical protein